MVLNRSFGTYLRSETTAGTRCDFGHSGCEEPRGRPIEVFKEISPKISVGTKKMIQAKEIVFPIAAVRDNNFSSHDLFVYRIRNSSAENRLSHSL